MEMQGETMEMQGETTEMQGEIGREHQGTQVHSFSNLLISLLTNGFSIGVPNISRLVSLHHAAALIPTNHMSPHHAIFFGSGLGFKVSKKKFDYQ